jgi:hypothetical protein
MDIREAFSSCNRMIKKESSLRAVQSVDLDCVVALTWVFEAGNEIWT